MAHIIKDNRMIPVKNLGWLLANWKRVERFVILETILIAYDRDLLPIYIVTWADFNVLIPWLHRPVFKGLPLEIWRNNEHTITVC